MVSLLDTVDTLSLSLSWRLLFSFPAQEVCDVAGFLQEEDNLSVNGSHVSSQPQGWKPAGNWSFGDGLSTQELHLLGCV